MKISIYILVLIISFWGTAKSQDSLYLNLPDFQINKNIGSTAQSYVYPVALSENNFILYWRDARNGNVSFPFPVGGGEDMYSQKYDNNGTKLDNNIFLKSFNRWLKIASNKNGTNIRFFSVQNQLFFQKLDFNLAPISNIVQLNTQDFFAVNPVGYSPIVKYDLSVKYNGNFLAVWQGKKNSLHKWEIYGQKFNSELQPISENIKLFEKRLNGDYNSPVVKLNSDSNFVIASAAQQNNLKSIYVQIYSDTLMFSTAIVANDFTNGIYASSNPSIGICRNSFNIVWIGTDNQIYVQKFSNTGEKIGENIVINKNSIGNGNIDPSISSLSSGHSLITWTKWIPTHYWIYAQLLDSLNNTILNTDMLISDEGSKHLVNAKTLSVSENKFLITWYSWNNGNFPNIYFKILDNEGNIVISEMKANDDVGSSFQVRSNIKIQNNFNFLVWEDSRKTKRDIFFRSFSNDGINNEVNVSNFSAYSNFEPIVSILPDNNVFVTWSTDSSPLYGQLLSKYGVKIDGLIEITDEDVYTLGDSPKSAVNAAGKVLIAWNSYRSSSGDIYYQLFDNKLNKIGVNKLVNSVDFRNVSFSPDCFINNSGEFYICWFTQNYSNNYTTSDIRIKKYIDYNIPNGDSYVINDEGNVDNIYPRIASNQSTGNFVVTWSNNRNKNFDIYAQMFDKKGAFVGTNFKVNDNLDGTEQNYPVVAMDNNDNFVIAWQDYRNGNPDIYAQIFLANGDAWGKNFLVNTDTAKMQYSPSVSVNGNDIHFSWTTNHVGGTGFDIWTNSYKWDTILGIAENSSSENMLTFKVYPNPFNAAINLQYFIPNSGTVEISLYNSLGQKLELLEHSLKNRGSYNIYFSPKQLSSGTYFVALKFNQKYILTKKILYLK